MSKDNIFSQIEGYADVLQDKISSQSHGINMEQQSLISSRLVARLHPKTLSLRVTNIKDELAKIPGDVKTIRFVSAKGYLPPFEAGQYINLSVHIDGVTTSRAYSLSSAPSQTAYYEVTVKRVEGGFVSNHLLDMVKVGDTFSATSPAGEFHYNPLFHGDDLVMLAGGSGITPMMSMIRQFTNMGSDKKIHLIYICRTPDDVIFCEEFETLSSQYDTFSFTKVISRPKEHYQGITGHITAVLLTSLLQNIKDKTYYICGPTGMCDAAKNDLKSLGVRRGKIRQETFGETADVTQMAGWPDSLKKGDKVKVTIAGGHSFDAPAGEPLLNSLDRTGLRVPSSCHAGECSLCRIKLVEGSVYTLANSKERASDKTFGYIHSCSSYPTSDIEIEI